MLTTYNIIAKEVVLDENDKNGEQPIKDEPDNDTEQKDPQEAKVDESS